ncbi:MAG: toprim domain-containing protein [Pseudomonadota bacterium]
MRRRKLHDAEPLTMPRPKAAADHRALALRLWKASQPIADSPAADYLAARGLPPPYPRCLRYNPRTIVGAGDHRRYFPAMIAAVENDLGVVAVQRTCLDPADILHKPLPKPKIALGLLGNAAIRLAQADEELGLAEGIEDALSATAWFGTPTWALGGVERLGLVAIPERVKRIIVYGDRGAAAAAMLKKAHPHLTANGRELVLRLPERHADWNDAWRVRQAAEAA